jgi:hypothetical protein
MSLGLHCPERHLASAPILHEPTSFIPAFCARRVTMKAALSISGESWPSIRATAWL